MLPTPFLALSRCRTLIAPRFAPSLFIVSTRSLALLSSWPSRAIRSPSLFPRQRQIVRSRSDSFRRNERERESWATSCARAPCRKLGLCSRLLLSLSFADEGPIARVRSAKIPPAPPLTPSTSSDSFSSVAATRSFFSRSVCCLCLRRCFFAAALPQPPRGRFPSFVRRSRVRELGPRYSNSSNSRSYLSVICSLGPSSPPRRRRRRRLCFRLECVMIIRPCARGSLSFFAPPCGRGILFVFPLFPAKGGKLTF